MKKIYCIICGKQEIKIKTPKIYIFKKTLVCF